MEDEREIIRQQMTETRTALSNKIELLEQEIVDTVHDAKVAVADTAANVKDAVQDTVQTMKSSVADSVKSVKETFDLKLQVQKRPWTMVTGAVAVGYLGSCLFRGKTGQAGDGVLEAPDARWDVAPTVGGRIIGNGFAANSPAKEPGFLAKLGETFESEFTQLRELSVGTLFGIARDMLMDSLPKPLEHQVEELIDGITVKLGGRPIRGPVLSEVGCNERFASGPFQECESHHGHNGRH